MLRSLIYPLLRLKPQLLLWYIPAILLLCAGLLVSIATSSPLGFLTRDPTAILGGHPLVGAFSNIGVLLWCAAASVCLFTSVSLKGSLDSKIQGCLFFGGLLSGVLLFDDLFLVHEELGPRYLGMDEKLIYLSYASMIGAYLLKFRKVLIDHEPFFLFASLGLFAISVLFDSNLFGPPQLSTFFVEESAKYLGILSWCIFHLRLSALGIRKALAN